MTNNSKNESEEPSKPNVEGLVENLKKNLKESEEEIEKKNKSKKKPAIGATLIVLVVLLALIIIVVFIIKSNFQNNLAINNITNTLSQINTNYVVDINRLGFMPINLEIHKGDLVIWKNQNFSSHKIVFDSGNIESFDLDKLGNYSRVFDKSGIYEYHSTTQVYMRGKIIVD